MWKRMKKPLALVLAMAMLISLVSFEQLPVTAGSPETQTEASQEAKSAEASKTEGTEKKENKDTKETEESSSQKEDTSSKKESTEEEKSSEAKSTEDSKDSKEESTGEKNTEETDSKEKTTEKSEEESESTKETKEESSEVKYTASSQSGEVSVTAYAQKDAFPENTSMKVTKLGETALKEAEKSLKDQNVSYDGVFGYDISFYTKDGKEIEPSQGSVRVKFEMNADLLPEDAQEDTVVMRHLKETKDGTVDVQTVAAAGDKISIGDKKVETEFKVESFSYFLITYNDEKKLDELAPRIKVQIVDDKGNDIPCEKSIELDAEAITTMNGVSIDTLKKDLQGYTYQGTYIDKPTTSGVSGTALDKISVTRTTSNSTASYQWKYTLKNSSTSHNLGSAQTGDGSSTTAPVIYMVYQLNAKLYIQDNIRKTDSSAGTLQAVWKSEKPEESSEKKIVYKWYKFTDTSGVPTTADAADSTKWTPITRTKITGSSWNMDETGENFNVALNILADNQSDSTKGQYYYYMVRAYYEGSEDYNSAIGSALSDKVQYYDRLQNGGFESPTSSGDDQYAVGTSGLYWNTTGTDKKVEIVNGATINDQYGFTSKSPNGTAYGSNNTKFGKQYAELNAGTEGALYQDVLTAPKSTMYWSLYHRARYNTGKDTMYLIIMPTSAAEKYTTTAEILAAINNGTLKTDASKGILVEKISDQAWTYHSGSYSVPENQYATRFFFVAGSTASNNNKIGNFLDNVAFSTEIPAPDPGKGQIQVEKTVKGLSETEIKNYSLDITAKLGTTETKKTVDTFYKQTDGSYKATVVFQNMAVGNYTVSESNTQVTGYTLSSTPTTGTQSVTVNDGATSTTSFTNTYTPNKESLKITKKITGLSKTQAESLKNALTFEVKDTEKQTVDVEFTASELTESSGTYTYTLTSKDKVLEPSEEYTISETTGTADVNGYQLKASEAQTVTPEQGKDAEVSFTNTYTQPTLTVNKTVTGNMGETDKAFTFTLKLTKDSTAYTEDLSATKGTTTQTLTQDAGKYSFTLKDSESITITVPYNYTYTVTEADYSSDGYTAYIGTGDSKKESREASGDLTEDKTETFTNDKDVVVPGGLQGNSNSWYLLIGAAFVLAGGFGFLKLRGKKAGQRV